MRRTAVLVSGWVLTLAGVVLFPLPGPGLLLLAAGLALLAQEQEWAAARVERVRVRAWQGAVASVRTPLRTAWTVLVTAALGASGGLWLWAPPEPSWWVLPSWTWLPGGWWSGIGQIVSGVVALAVVAHAHRLVHRRQGRTRGRPRCAA